MSARINVEREEEKNRLAMLKNGYRPFPAAPPCHPFFLEPSAITEEGHVRCVPVMADDLPEGLDLNARSVVSKAMIKRWKSETTPVAGAAYPLSVSTCIANPGVVIDFGLISRPVMEAVFDAMDDALPREVMDNMMLREGPANRLTMIARAGKDVRAADERLGIWRKATDRGRASHFVRIRRKLGFAGASGVHSCTVVAKPGSMMIPDRFKLEPVGLYEWIGDLSPLTTPRDKLPILTTADITTITEVVREVMEGFAPEWNKIEHDPPVPGRAVYDLPTDAPYQVGDETTSYDALHGDLEVTGAATGRTFEVYRDGGLWVGVHEGGTNRMPAEIRPLTSAEASAETIDELNAMFRANRTGQGQQNHG